MRHRVSSTSMSRTVGFILGQSEQRALIYSGDRMRNCTIIYTIHIITIVKDFLRIV